MITEFKISDSYRKHAKSEAFTAIFLISFSLFFIPPILFMEHWYIALSIGVMLIPIWIKVRWANYKKEIIDIDNHKMVVTDNSLQFHYKISTYDMCLSQLKHININIKKGQIISIRLLMLDGTIALLSEYENMDKLEKLLINRVNNQNISYHRWFHRNN